MADDGMDQAEKAKYAQLVFKELLLNDGRLARGQAVRKEMWEAVAAGRQPDGMAGVRWEWINRCAAKVQRFLANACLDWNTQHSDDRASMADVGDLIDLVKAKVGEAGK